MGCRTRVFEDRFGEKTSIGRGNLSFSTINIVRIAIECMPIQDRQERIDKFFSRLDEVLDITARQLCHRYEFQKTALAKQFPLVMSRLWIGADKLRPTDTVESVINHGTLGIGFIGLAELHRRQSPRRIYVRHESVRGMVLRLRPCGAVNSGSIPERDWSLYNRSCQ